MPGWHEATRELQAAGRLQMVGIIQEQHPARCRLFMQWKQMEWPILVDSFDLLEIDVVPLTLVIDEWGIVRHRGLRVPDAARIGEIFLDRAYEPAPGAPPAAAPGDGADASDWRAYALYYVCEDVDGTCLYRRQDFGVDVEVVRASGPAR